MGRCQVSSGLYSSSLLVKVSPEILRQVKIAAACERRSITSVVREGLNAYLERFKSTRPNWVELLEEKQVS